MKSTQRARRLLVTGVVGAMVFSLLPAGAAVAVPDLCDGAPDAGFTDVTAGNTFRDDINCLAAYGITTGITATTYGPALDVNRQQMAAFVLRYWEAATGDTLPVPATDQFSDIANVSPASTRNAINALANAGVISGFPDGTYRPGGDVRRDQMATFIANATEAAGLDLPEDAADDRFPDVRATATHSDNINILAELGIVGGFNDGTYRPGNDVSRQQMARFIINGAGVLDADGKWDAELEVPTESNQTFAVTSDETQVPSGTELNVTADVGDAAEVTVYLLDADDVTVTDGIVTFSTDDDGDFDGSLASDRNVITEVDGVAVPNEQARVIAPADGSIDLTIQADDEDAFVVFVVESEDGVAGDVPDLDEDGAPVEAFGVTGTINVQDLAGIALFNAADDELILDLDVIEGTVVTVDAVLADAGLDVVALDGETIDYTIAVVANATACDVLQADQSLVTLAQTALVGSAVTEGGIASFDIPAGDDGATHCALASVTPDEDGTYADEATVTSFAVDGHGTVNYLEDDATATMVAFNQEDDIFTAVNGTTTLSATVTDDFGRPVAGERVEFEIVGSTTPTLEFIRTTNANGVATVAYSRNVNSSDFADVCILDDADDCTVTAEGPDVFWFTALAVADADGTHELIGSDTANDYIYAQTATDAFVRVSYSTAAAFQVGGTPVAKSAFETELDDDDSDVGSVTISNADNPNAPTTFNIF